MPNLLWNAKEKRLRALWRLLLHTLLFLILLAVFNTAVILLAFFVAGPQEIPLTDPNFTQQLDALIAANPFLVILSSIVTVFGFILATWMAGRFLDKRRFAGFGFHFNRLWWMDLGFGLALGALLMLGIFLVQITTGWIEVTDTFYTPGKSFGTGLLAAAVLFTGVGIQEELLSRGYHLRNIAEGLNHPRIGARTALLFAYIFSSSIFGFLHLANPHSSLISTVNLILAGLFLGLGFLLTGELAIPIGLHITWNFFQGNVFGFPVSGTDAGATFIQIQQGGPDLWTGGPFGPEAGMIGLLAMMIGSLLTILWVRTTRGQSRLQTHLAEYSREERVEPDENRIVL